MVEGADQTRARAVGAAVVAGFFEESLFRGMLMTVNGGRARDPFPQILPGLAFGALT